MDSNHRDERITINERGNRVLNQHFSAPCYDLAEIRTRIRGDVDVIVHLAAKAGVRPSIADPIAYQEVNVRGTQNLLEIARERGISHFVFASSSSVYGINPRVPWSEDHHVLQPISPYASTKVSGELLGHVYSHLYGIRFIALRFFTVYGPRQRPDLAIHKFASLMLEGRPVPTFGDGTTRRDYTFIDDIVAGNRSAITYEISLLWKERSGRPFEGDVIVIPRTEMVPDVLPPRAGVIDMPNRPSRERKIWGQVQGAQFGDFSLIIFEKP